MTLSYHVANSSGCLFVLNNLREMLSHRFSSFSPEDPLQVRSSGQSCFLEDTGASSILYDKDLQLLFFFTSKSCGCGLYRGL